MPRQAVIAGPDLWRGLLNAKTQRKTAQVANTMAKAKRAFFASLVFHLCDLCVNASVSFAFTFK